jgi:hypothetical protein
VRVESEEFERQVQAISDQLMALADGLANDGLVVASGVVLSGRQMIRALWTRLNPPAPAAEEKPAEDVVVTEAAPEAPQVP